MGMPALVARLRTMRWTIGASASDSGWAPYIFRTILSENQYETKFITSAITKARTMPDRPPSRPPMAMNRPVIRASNRVVLTALTMVRLLRGQTILRPARWGWLNPKASRGARERQGESQSSDE